MSEYEEDENQLKKRRVELMEMKHNILDNIESLENRLSSVKDALINIDAKLEYINYLKEKEVGKAKVAEEVEEVDEE